MSTITSTIGRSSFTPDTSATTRSLSATRRIARIAALDATRGIAMGLVCLSHFAWAATFTNKSLHGMRFIMTVTLIAAPTFMLVSGMTLGYVGKSVPEAYQRFSSKLLERGIFLLTVAHLLMLPSRIYLAPGLDALRSVEMTDTIGLCILIGPFLVARLRPKQRIVLSVALVAIAWTVIILVPDDLPGGVRAIEHALFGHRSQDWWYSSFPVVPWLGVYLLGTVVGEQLLPAEEAARDHNSGVLLRWAAVLAACAVLLELVLVTVAAAFPGVNALITWAATLGDPFWKFPPSPAYFLVHMASGMALAAITTLCLDRQIWRWLSDRAQEVGRASLFVFIVQSYLYFLIEVHWLRPLPMLWPFAFAASLVVVVLAAKGWLRIGGNRWLTVPGLSHARAVSLSPRLGAGRD